MPSVSHANNSHHRKIDFLWRIIACLIISLMIQTATATTISEITIVLELRINFISREREIITMMMIMNKTYHLQFVCDTVNDLDGFYSNDVEYFFIPNHHKAHEGEVKKILMRYTVKWLLRCLTFNHTLGDEVKSGCW